NTPFAVASIGASRQRRAARCPWDDVRSEPGLSCAEHTRDEGSLEAESTNQLAVAGVLLGALVLFAWGRWRYDVVALVALLALVLLDIVPAEDAFRGFGHPAVITV